jgi:hypothetical protein
LRRRIQRSLAEGTRLEVSAIVASPAGFVRHRYVHAKRPLRRLAVELVLVVIAKVAFLMLIWWLVFSPHPKPDSSAAAIANRLGPGSPSIPKVQP